MSLFVLTVAVCDVTGYLLMAPPVNHHLTTLLLWTEEAYCHSLLWRLTDTVCCGRRRLTDTVCCGRRLTATYDNHTDLYINICTSIISDKSSREVTMYLWVVCRFLSNINLSVMVLFVLTASVWRHRLPVDDTTISQPHHTWLCLDKEYTHTIEHILMHPFHFVAVEGHNIFWSHLFIYLFI